MQNVQTKTNKKTHLKGQKSKDNFELFTMAMPGYILSFVFCYLPMFGIIIAFKKYNPNIGIWASKWVGLKNFQFFFKSNDFLMLMRNTIGYGVLFLLLDNVFNILLAYAFYNVNKKSALKFYQTTSILPNFISMVLVAFIVYAFLSPTNGLLNRLIEHFGGEGIDWYSKPNAWPFILSIVQVWKSVGMGSLLYYACMVGIDEALFEAADMDGAKKIHHLWYIIIPEIGALLGLKLIMGVGSLVNGDFGLFYQVPMNVGTLYPTTDIINTYVFRALQSGTNMERTAAVGLFQSLTGTILLLITNTVVRKVSPENSMF